MRSLTGLQALLAVAEKGGFTAAAKALGVSASAVSQAVRALEEDRGATFLSRTTRSVGLTEAGLRLVNRAGPALRQALAALDEAGSDDGVSGLLRLSVSTIAVDAVIAPALPPLLEEHPRLRVEVSVDNRMIDIVAGGYDAGVRLGEAIERDMVAVRLSRPCRFVVVGAPSYLRAHGRPSTPRALGKHRCMAYRAGPSGALLRWELERRGRVYEVAVEGPLICDNADLMLQAARAGVGLAYMYEPMALADVARGALEIVLEEYAAEAAGFFLYFPRRAQRQPKLRAFLTHARRASGLERGAARPEGLAPAPVCFVGQMPVFHTQRHRQTSERHLAFAFLGLTLGWVDTGGLPNFRYCLEVLIFCEATAVLLSVLFGALFLRLLRRDGKGELFDQTNPWAQSGPFSASVFGFAIAGASLLGVTALIVVEIIVHESLPEGAVRSFEGASYGLFIGPAAAVSAWAFAKSERRGRGSMVASADARTAWAFTLLAGLFVAWLRGRFAGDAGRLSLVLCLGVAVTAALSWLFAVSIGSLWGLKRLLSGLELRQNFEPEVRAHVRDLGVGDDYWVGEGAGVSSYRRAPGAVRVVYGSAPEAWALLIRAAAFSAAFLACSVALAAQSARQLVLHYSIRASNAARVEPAPGPPAPTGFYPSADGGPLVVDVSGDGVEDVLTLRWDALARERPLSVVAIDGASFQTIWRTPPFWATWADPNVHLLRSGSGLFVTDPKGAVHVFSLGNGGERAPTVSAVVAAFDRCAAAEGEVWLQGGMFSDRGWLVGDGGAAETKRPPWCAPRSFSNANVPFCGEGVSGVCVSGREARPKRAGFFGIDSYEEGNVGVTYGRVEGSAGPRQAYLAGFDPRDGSLRWEKPVVPAGDAFEGARALRFVVGGAGSLRHCESITGPRGCSPTTAAPAPCFGGGRSRARPSRRRRRARRASMQWSTAACRCSTRRRARP